VDSRGNIRELDGKYPSLAAEEILISAEIAAKLQRLSIRQRQRFYKAIKQSNNEDVALHKAMCRP
jgi:hypothetical protein